MQAACREEGTRFRAVTRNESTNPATFANGVEWWHVCRLRHGNEPTSFVDVLGLWTLGGVLKEQLPNFKGQFARSWPVGAIGPVPVFLTLVGTAEVRKCKNDKGIEEVWLKAAVTVEAYGSLGSSFDSGNATHSRPKGRDRNKRAPDNTTLPRQLSGKDDKLKRLAGKPNPPPGGFRQQVGGVELGSTKDCSCPNKPSLSLSLSAFIRGTAGVGVVGYAADTTFPIASTKTTLDDISFTQSAVFGVAGASLEAGMAGTVEIEGPATLDWLQ